MAAKLALGPKEPQTREEHSRQKPAANPGTSPRPASAPLPDRHPWGSWGTYQVPSKTARNIPAIISSILLQRRAACTATSTTLSRFPPQHLTLTFGQAPFRSFPVTPSANHLHPATARRGKAAWRRRPRGVLGRALSDVRNTAELGGFFELCFAGAAVRQGRALLTTRSTERTLTVWAAWQPGSLGPVSSKQGQLLLAFEICQSGLIPASTANKRAVRRSSPAPLLLMGCPQGKFHVQITSRPPPRRRLTIPPARPWPPPRSPIPSPPMAASQGRWA